MLRLFTLCILCALFSYEGTASPPSYQPTIEGTVRAKYEYNTNLHAHRFQVRNARFSVNGQINKRAFYKAEIDLSDKGKTTMLDAYVRLHPYRSLSFSIGQQRIPFGNDVLRSPHLLYFANRSFIAKQMSAGLRDVGAILAYSSKESPFDFRMGIFNGKGITHQDQWEKRLSWVVRGGVTPCSFLKMNVGYYTFRTYDVRIQMYNASAFVRASSCHLEGEYTLRRYAHSLMRPTHAFSIFFLYDHPLKSGPFYKITPLIRFDRMTDASNGRLLEDGTLGVDEIKRSRLTGGVTLSLDEVYLNDIRLNYEHYFFGPGVVNKESKLVVEFVVRF